MYVGGKKVAVFSAIRPLHLGSGSQSVLYLLPIARGY